MKHVALVVIVLVWMVLASLPRGSDGMKEVNWFDEAFPSIKTDSQAAIQASTQKPVPGPKPAAPKSSRKMICRKSGEPFRSLVIDSKGRGCELVYKKPEGAESMAWSDSSIRTCREVRDRISRRLETAGYRCDGAS